MPKINRLTLEQIGRFPEFVDKWTKIGLCTEPADRPTAERAIIEMYRQAGLAPPEKIVWCGSPLSQGLTRAIVLDKRIRANAGASVGDSVWASVRDSVGASVWDSVGASVGDSVGDSVRASVRASVGASVYGAHDAGWLSFYDYFADAANLTEQTSKLSGLWLLARSAGWALPHERICWVSERHHVLHRDDRGRLHSLAGPAVAYPDGWAIYAVHGVRIPSHVIDRPEQITVATIDAEANAEIRRVMIDRYRHGEEVAGAAAYLRDAGAISIDHDERWGTLWRRDIPDDEPIQMVEVVNSTAEPDGARKRYFLRVHPECRPLLGTDAAGEPSFGLPQELTARNAIASTFGLRGEQYMPLAET